VDGSLIHQFLTALPPMATIFIIPSQNFFVNNLRFYLPPSRLGI
jgi:hypothetical protein